jgi:chromosome segregation ATPase
LIESNSRENAGLEEKFQILEAKILQAVEVISDLKEKNLRLESSVEKAQNQITDLEKQLRAARDEMSEADKWKDQAQELIRVKELVTGKIETLLAQIDTLPLVD